MIKENISHLRLYNQFISKKASDNIEDLVFKMGALQAQDYNMVKWAIGTRSPNSTVIDFDKAIDEAKIIRTHLLRPTWHIISAKDIYWMLDLTAPQIKSAMKSRDKGLGLDETVCKKCNKIIEKAILSGGSLTRDEIVKILIDKANICNDNNRVYHILMRAELDKLICSGETKGKQRTYALLEERVPEKKTLTKSEALFELAKRYFTTRGPATLQDFIWWSGLSANNARLALESCKHGLQSEIIDSQKYWFTSISPTRKSKKDQLYLLPAFDEFIICYRDRSAIFSLENHSKAVLKNGIFKPVIIMNNEVVGTWRPNAKKDSTLIEITLFDSNKIINAKLIENEVRKFGKFINRKIEFSLY